VFTKVGNTLTYEYDFGDGWMHHLELVEISTHPIDEVLPQIIGGEHACPYEDCVGTHGYSELKEILLNLNTQNIKVPSDGLGVSSTR
jgi:hypothetical protein